MDTQTDVTLGFSQNMPSRSRSITRSGKRSRTSSRSASIPRGIRTNVTKRTWPYASKGTGQLFDPFPAQMRCRLRYSQVVVLDPSIGSAALNLFRANSIYDPDLSGVGHQPYGHDTYASIYNVYKVNSATITMTPLRQTSGIYGITITDDSTIQGNYDTLREIKTTKMSGMGAGGTSGFTVTNYYNRYQVFPKDADGIGANFGFNPSNQQFFHCWFEGPSSDQDANATEFMFTITYDVTCEELKDLGQS